MTNKTKQAHTPTPCMPNCLIGGRSCITLPVNSHQELLANLKLARRLLGNISGSNIDTSILSIGKVITNAEKE